MDTSVKTFGYETLSGSHIFPTESYIQSINQSKKFYSGLSSRATARTTKGVTVNE